MPRLSALDKLNRDLKDAYGSKAETTERGMAGWDRGRGFNNTGGLDAIAAALRPEYSINFQIPSRDEAVAYLMQEMYSVCSPFSRAIKQLAGDASQDSMADTQPHVILIDGESESREEKIFQILTKAFRTTEVGINTYMRNRIALLHGTAVGQPIFWRDGFKWHLAKVKLMPTWEMIRNAKTDTWVQLRKGFANQIIGRWDIPGFLATTFIDEDDNAIYGTPVGQHVVIDYKMMVMALQDVAVAGRTRAPARIVHYVGFDDMGRIIVDDDAIKEYQNRVKSSPITVVTDYYLKRGYEKLEELKGDPGGVEALIKILTEHQNRMKSALGLPIDPEKQSGRGLESVDANYARNINIVRMADSKFLKNIGDKALLLEGYTDVDWSTTIPPIGETESNRVTRASKELQLGHIGHDMYCAIVGHKSPRQVREDIKRWVKFCEENNMPIPGTNGAQVEKDRQDVVGTENPDKGADPQKGRTRRQEQRTAGKTVTGA